MKKEKKNDEKVMYEQNKLRRRKKLIKNFNEMMYTGGTEDT